MTCCKHLVHKESAIKTMSYFTVHIFIAFFVSWIVSGSLTIALGISMLEPLFQMVGYYIHERYWHKGEKLPVHLSPEEIQKEIEHNGKPTVEQEIHMGTLEEYEIGSWWTGNWNIVRKRHMVKTLQQPWARKKFDSWKIKDE